MSGDFEIEVATGREERSIAGMDTVIVSMPQRFYVTVNDERTLVIVEFGRALRKFSEDWAHSLGEALHHAEYVITTNAAVVSERGAVHDCEICRAGTERALVRLSEHPERELLVGLLYWAGP